MLPPTLTRLPESSGFKATQTGRVATPCAGDPARFLDPCRRHQAAAACERCPVASACLQEGMRLHHARLAGEDFWGAYGCWAGVWFEPGQIPEHIPRPSARGAA